MSTTELEYILPPCARPGDPAAGDWWTEQHKRCTGVWRRCGEPWARCTCSCHAVAVVPAAEDGTITVSLGGPDPRDAEPASLRERCGRLTDETVAVNMELADLRLVVAKMRTSLEAQDRAWVEERSARQARLATVERERDEARANVAQADRLHLADGETIHDLRASVAALAGALERLLDGRRELDESAKGAIRETLDEHAPKETT